MSARTSSIGVYPIAGSLGAEIEGLDLRAPLSDEAFAEVQRALDQYLVIFFRDQDISREQQVSFTRRFGPACPTPFIETMSDHPEVIEIIKESDEKSRFVFGGGWHSDFSFQKQPPYITCLRAAEVPAFGGDTVYANMISAHESLPDALKNAIKGRIGLHSGERAYSPKMQALQDLLENMSVVNDAEAEIVQSHPLVRVHPKTGLSGLFINPVYTIGIEGMPDDEAQDLLQELNRYALAEPNTCRFRWRNDSIAVWDNRFTQHYALNDYPGKRRHMFRTTAGGEVPTSA